MNIALGDSSSDRTGDRNDHAMTAKKCEPRPRIERGSVSNPSMTIGNSDDVLTQTTYRARAQQGVEHDNDTRR